MGGIAPMAPTGEGPPDPPSIFENYPSTLNIIESPVQAHDQTAHSSTFDLDLDLTHQQIHFTKRLYLGLVQIESICRQENECK